MKRLGLSLFLCALAGATFAQPTKTFTPAQQALIDEHVYGGLPDTNPVLVRQGYVLEYDSADRIPRWVAYHVVPDYLKRPKRRGKFSTFRTDPDLQDPAKDADYRGFMDARGHTRGCVAPLHCPIRGR